MSVVTRVENFARAGFLARAVTYGLLGYFALTTSGTAQEGPTGIFRQVRDGEAGQLLVLLLAMGLFGYGMYRLYGAAVNIDGHDKGAKGIAMRIGHAASGVGHTILALSALNLAIGSGGGSGAREQEAAQTLLGIPLGPTILGIIGVGFLLAAGEQAVKAYTAKFMNDLASNTPDAVRIVGRVGYGARAAVFAIIGYSIVRASWFESSGEVKGAGGALKELSGSGLPYTLVALGLLLFGVFSLAQARYKRIRNEDVIERLKSRASML